MSHLSAWTVAALYSTIRDAANQLGMGQHLPDDYRVLNETRRA